MVSFVVRTEHGRCSAKFSEGWKKGTWIHELPVPSIWIKLKDSVCPCLLQRKAEPSVESLPPSVSEIQPKRRRTVAADARESLPALEEFVARNDGLPGAEAATLVTWGNGEMGQLGLGPDVTDKRRPARVKAGTKFTHIACCSIHTLAVEAPTADASVSVVVSMGCNDEGALGRTTENEDECSEPGPLDLVRMPTTFKVAKVCGGDSHSALLTTYGRVFICGVFRVSSGPKYRTFQRFPTVHVLRHFRASKVQSASFNLSSRKTRRLK